MIDKNEDPNQDEYQFTDLDMMEPESEEIEAEPKAGSSSDSPIFANKDLIRKGLMVVGFLIVSIVLYKFVASMFSSASVEAPVSKPVIKPIASTMPVAKVPVIQQKPSPEEMQKIAAIELNQGNMSTDVNNLTNQLGQVSTNVNDLNTKIQQLTETMNALVAQVAQQSQQITAMTVRVKPVQRHLVHRKTPGASVSYYIQAIIPGRAWLVASNGATMTVREGSTVPGYGVIRLIDPNEGRVLTSSGRSITFSQQDS